MSPQLLSQYLLSPHLRSRNPKVQRKFQALEFLSVSIRAPEDLTLRRLQGPLLGFDPAAPHQSHVSHQPHLSHLLASHLDGSRGWILDSMSTGVSTAMEPQARTSPPGFQAGLLLLYVLVVVLEGKLSLGTTDSCGNPLLAFERSTGLRIQSHGLLYTLLGVRAPRIALWMFTLGCSPTG